MQFGCGSIEGAEELREKAKERVWFRVRAQAPARACQRRRGRRRVVASSCSTLTLCQQVESVIAVSGEGGRARTPITNHRLPPLGSWSRIVFLEEKHSNPSELSKSIHDSEILPSPSGILCVPGSELLLCFFSLSRFDHFICCSGRKRTFVRKEISEMTLDPL